MIWVNTLILFKNKHIPLADYRKEEFFTYFEYAPYQKLAVGDTFYSFVYYDQLYKFKNIKFSATNLSLLKYDKQNRSICFYAIPKNIGKYQYQVDLSIGKYQKNINGSYEVKEMKP